MKELEVVTISKHAEKQLKERLGLQKKALQRMADLAYVKGIQHSETKGNLNKWVTSLYFKNRAANNIRLHGDKAFIFSGTTLVTIIQIPANLFNHMEDYVKPRESDSCKGCSYYNPDNLLECMSHEGCIKAKEEEAL